VVAVGAGAVVDHVVASIRAGIDPPATGTAHALLWLRIATLLAAQLFDYGTFTVMIARHGAMAEANPLVAQGLVAYGLPMLALVKAALVLLLGSIVIILGRPTPLPSIASRIATIVALLAVASGLLGGVSNVLVFVD
jgi:hypothetical protein